MEVNAIIDGINEQKIAVNMTNQQIADASGVPKSTVDRILRKATPNPTIQVILDIAGAVGYDITSTRKSVDIGSPGDEKYIQHIITMYESQLAAQERQYNLVTAEKNRWIKWLAIIVAILGAGIITILLIDILNPNVGWFQRQLANSTSENSWTSFLGFLAGWLNI